MPKHNLVAQVFQSLITIWFQEVPGAIVAICILLQVPHNNNNNNNQDARINYTDNKTILVTVGDRDKRNNTENKTTMLTVGVKLPDKTTYFDEIESECSNILTR